VAEDREMGTTSFSERQNTIVCIFEQQSPRVSALDIHEWIFDTLRRPEAEVRLIQIEGARRHVYIKLSTQEYAKEIVTRTEGRETYKHENGVMSTVQIDYAGMGTRKIRIADLPPEMPDYAIRNALTPYGEVMSINHETWSHIYRYKVPNGIRTALTSIKKHIPSRLQIGGHRATITYEGQPPTCFGCNGADHQYQTCPKRKQRTPQKERTQTTWAELVQQGTTHPETTTQHEDERDGLKKQDITTHGTQQTAMEEARELQGSSAVQNTTDGNNNGEYREDERKEVVKPQYKKNDRHVVKPNWADDQEEETPMDTATKTNDPQQEIEERGDGAGAEITGKDETTYEDISVINETRLTDKEMTKQVGMTSPKRTKKLKTDRETPYHQSRTRSKTRTIQPTTITMTQ